MFFSLLAFAYNDNASSFKVKNLVFNDVSLKLTCLRWKRSKTDKINVCVCARGDGMKGGGGIGKGSLVKLLSHISKRFGIIKTESSKLSSF